VRAVVLATLDAIVRAVSIKKEALRARRGVVGGDQDAVLARDMWPELVV